MFLRLYKVNRVLFLVDRLELETQAKKEINDILSRELDFKLFWSFDKTCKGQRLFYSLR